MAVADYLRGTGTSADPYIIHNAIAAQAFFSQTAPCFMTNAYFSVVANIDCSSFQLPSIDWGSSAPEWLAKLNGNGYAITNIYVPGSGFCKFTSEKNAEIESIKLHFKRCAGAVFAYADYQDNRWKTIKNSEILLDSGKFFLYTSHMLRAVNLITNQTVFGYIYDPLPTTVYICSPTSFTPTFSGGVILIGNNRFLPTNYPSLTEDIWSLDGVSLPSLIPNTRTDLTQKYAIAGSTKVGGISKKRKIALFTSAYLGLLKKIDTAADGTYLIDMGDVYDPVYVMHYDDYGFPLVANTAYALGAYIHPKTPNGYRYKCTTAGTSGATLPAESWPTSSSLTSGTAIFSPEPVYKTETFLVSPHLYDFLTGQPV